MELGHYCLNRKGSIPHGTKVEVIVPIELESIKFNLSQNLVGRFGPNRCFSIGSLGDRALPKSKTVTIYRKTTLGSFNGSEITFKQFFVGVISGFPNHLDIEFIFSHVVGAFIVAGR